MVPVMETINLGNEKRDPDKLIRKSWAESLQDHLDSFFDPITATRGLTRKQFQARLREHKIDVSLQSIGLWLSGQTAPRPSMQIAIGEVLGVPARRLFPLEKP